MAVQGAPQLLFVSMCSNRVGQGRAHAPHAKEASSPFSPSPNEVGSLALLRLEVKPTACRLKRMVPTLGSFFTPLRSVFALEGV